MGEELTRRLSLERRVELAQLANGGWHAATTDPYDRTRIAVAHDPIDALLALCDTILDEREWAICSECEQYANA